MMFAKNKLLSKVIDLLLIISVVVFGWFLIGYYTQYQFLDTGYQDWIYHGFRIQSIERHGISSWDPIWANGLNHWKNYQYLPHLLTLGIKQQLHISATQAMLYVTAGIFIFYLSSMYVLLRALTHRRLAVLLAISIGLTSAVTWNYIENFSVFFSFIVFPYYVFAWINDVKRKKSSYSVAGFAGIAWLLHPILGYISTGLWLFNFSTRLSKDNLMYIFKRGVIFLLAFSAFLIPYVTKGYTFSSPQLSSLQFFQMTLSNDYLGLGMLASAFLLFSWIINICFPARTEVWTKKLLLYISLFILLLLLANEGYAPAFIMQLQIGRIVPLLGIMAVFVFSSVIDALLTMYRSRFTLTIATVALAVIISRTIVINSVPHIGLQQTVIDPVAEFISQQQFAPTGTVYIENVSQASYFSPEGTRFVNSYNNHVEPHPLSQRFGMLLKNDLPYTGITKKQTELISSYSRVMGVEYLFLPELSPVIRNLTASESGQPAFRSVTSPVSGISILQNTQPISYAYSVPNEFQLNKETLVKPSLNVESWSNWDQELSTFEELLKSEEITPLAVEFKNTDQIILNLNSKPIDHSRIILLQSYDPQWRAENAENITISPTSLRFMELSLPKDFSNEKITLFNTWPAWHWPLQIFSPVFFAGVFVIEKIVVEVAKRHPRFKLPPQDTL